MGKMITRLLARSRFWRTPISAFFIRYLSSFILTIFLFCFFPEILFSQTGSAALTSANAKLFLEAEVILQKEFSKKHLAEEILKYNRIPEENLKGFKKFALEEYSKDKSKFLDDFGSGKLKKTNLPSYFSFLRAKYISLYKVFLSQKDNDNFSLFYKTSGGNNEVTGPGQPCDNMDIEQCNFTSWNLFQGTIPGTAPFSYAGITATGPGVQHFIESGGIDPIASASNPSGNIPKLYPDGGSCSVLLGDSSGTGAKGASMSQTFLVDSNNAVFTYSYAAVLQNPTSHAIAEMPYFRVRVYDSGGNSIPCGQYDVLGVPPSSGGDPSFTAATYAGEALYYKDWTTVFAPLNGYIGQNITVEFTSGDCSQGGHFGYAYVEAGCQPLKIIASSPVICGGGSITLSAPPGAATYAWTPGGQNTQTITVSTAGTYSVNVTPVSGSSCSINLTITVPSNPSIPIANFSATAPCVGNPTSFTDQSSVSSGTVTNWHWDFGVGGTTADTSNVQNPTYTYTTAGNFNVNLSVTTTAGCVQDTTLSVNVVAGFNATFTPDTFCNDEPPLNLTSVANGGTWSGTGITNTNSGTFNPTVAGLGTFPITYMGGTGVCKDTFIANVIVVGVAIDSVSRTNVICFGDNNGTLTVNATGAAQYTIDNGSGPITQTNGNFSSLAPGTYSITVTSAINNCQKTSSITITEPSVLALTDTSFDVTCYNTCNGYAIVIPSGGTSPYNYFWSNGTGNIATSTGLCAGSFFLTVSDSKGCAVNTSFTVNQPQDYNIDTLTANSNCGHPDGSAEIILISGQTSPYTYLWNNSDPDSSNTGIVNGTYSVTITDANGCDTVMQAIVGYNPPPVTTAAGIMTSCFGSCDGSAIANPSGGNPQPTPAYTYLWSNGDTTQTATALCAGAYTVTVYDEELCEGYVSVVVQQPQQLLLVPLPDDTVCIDSTGTIGANASGGTLPYTYSWDGGAFATTDSLKNVTPNSQTCYIVIAMDANNCVSNPQVQCISIFPQLFVMASGDNTICEGAPADISAFAFGGNPNNNISYSWNGGPSPNSQSQTVIPSGSFPNPVIFTVTATDGCAPPVTDDVTINFYLQPIADFFADKTLGCEADPVFNVLFDASISTNLTNPTIYIWSISDGSLPFQDADTFIYPFPDVGDYTVSLTIYSGPAACMDDTVKVNYISVRPKPTADFSFAPQPTTVQNMTIDFTDNSAIGNGDTLQSWQWSYYDNNGTTLLGNSPLQNTIFNFSSEPDNPFIFYLTDTGNYPVQLLVQTNNLCVDSITKYVKVDGVYYVNVPNAFTPNNDGINDYFFPIGVGIQPNEDFRFVIFNRWGDIIFESKSLDDPWDGTARSLGGKTLVKQDVYVWKLEFLDATREQNKHKGPIYTGHVTVVR